MVNNTKYVKIPAEFSKMSPQAKKKLKTVMNEHYSYVQLALNNVIVTEISREMPNHGCMNTNIKLQLL